MPVFSWTIDVGQVVTWVIAIGSMVYRFGLLSEAMRNVQNLLKELKADLKSHSESDDSRFADVQDSIQQILLRRSH